MNPVLIQLAWRFFLLGFVAIGGANAAVPEMHRYVVEVERWMTDGEFAALFAIANAAPGPNVLIVTLVGWHVAGIPGALVTTVAMLGPTGLLVYGVFHVWNRMRNAPWRPAVQNGLSAVTVGLVAATAHILTLATATNIRLAAVTAATAAASYLTKTNPLWCFAAAAALGAAGLL
ncbi:chromate transporter [Enterovirga sp.]|uniref:chromate transporter n=1 Tax=Enterovirga sp. TaxID=2026350 RepID=UPI002C84031F|nr:chromate transporter [Enterovirga sp.]HMO31167.1 chromate transporter [Enterovirga sp.]